MQGLTQASVTLLACFAASAALAATATFTPIGPTAVEAGQVVTFQVDLTSTTLGAFNTADVVIGSASAGDVGFAYDTAWTSAFANVTTPFFDTGVYPQDVYVGGNNAASVGSSLTLGTVTIDTTGISCGSHSIQISHAFDGFSVLGLNGVPEGLEGSASFEITVPGGCSLPPTIVWSADPAASTRATRSLVIGVTAEPGQTATAAILVTLIDLQNPDPANSPCCPPQNFNAYESATCNAAGETNSCTRWLGRVVTVREAQDNPGRGSFLASRLQCTPYYTDWTAVGSITIVGPEIMPSSTYELTAYASSCEGAEATCANVSTPVQALTRRSGDVAIPYAPSGTQPDGQDVVAAVNKFKSLLGSPSKAIAQIQPNVIELNTDLSGLDIVAVIDAFRGVAYPYSGPCPCPSTVICNTTACTPGDPCGGGLCIQTCTGGTNADQPCRNDNHCPGGTCPSTGFCRDRCGRCN